MMSDRIDLAIANAIQSEIQKIAMEEVDKAVASVTKTIQARVRRNLGAIAVSVLENYDMSRFQTDLMIKVRQPFPSD